jgi:diacylglycerol kinase family enzyme
MQNVLAVVNPRSGWQQGAHIVQWLSEIALSQGLHLTLRPTTSELSASALVSDAQQFDRVVVSGGDGTVTQVINGMVNTNIPLAIVPGGTGNVLAQAVGVRTDLRMACEDALSECEHIPVDLGLLNDKVYFALRMSIGYEALVTQDTTPELKTRFGKLAYLWQAYWHSLRMSTVRYRIDVDGRVLRTRAESVWVANTSILGILGLELDPEISMCDQQLDLCIFRFTLRRNVQRVLQWLLRRERLPATVVTRIPVRQYVNIAAAPRQPVQVDGDTIGHTPSRVRVTPGGVVVCKAKRRLL